MAQPPASPRTIILATANPHKVGELRDIFKCIGVPVIGLNDLKGCERLREPEEHGRTFAANAMIKACSYAAQIRELGTAPAGSIVLADDSGIEIDALCLPDGTARPGVISSHYCTDGQETGLSRAERDSANNARVLRELEHVPTDKRGARFVCCMCVASMDGKVLYETRGTFEGRIGRPPRVPSGTHGFGYDPLFLVAPSLERTGAELESEEKNRLSHRARAASGVVEWLRTS